MGTTRHVDVVIVGGGIAGLAAAHRIASTAPGVSFALIEAAPSVGGRLGFANVAGVTLDTAADAFLARVPGAVDLCRELGMQNDLVAPSTGNAGVFISGAIKPLPGGLVLGVPTDLDALSASGVLSAEGLARAAEDERAAKPLLNHDRSVGEAIGIHLGREVVERLVDPLLGGISAANCDDLSIEAAAPQLATATLEPHLMAALRDQQAISQRGQIGVTETQPVFLAPKQGVHTLVTRLSETLADHVAVHEAIDQIEKVPGGWKVGQVVATTVILATPAPVSAQLLAKLDPQASQVLNDVRMASVALVLLAYQTTHCDIPQGSGVLVPRTEKRFVTAASWWNHKWPHLATGDHTFIRASVGRIDDAVFHSFTNEEIVRRIDLDLKDMVKINTGPVDSHVARWMQSFPQYEVGHLGRIIDAERSLETSARGIFLAGASLRGVGMPACIRSGREAADASLTLLSGSF